MTQASERSATLSQAVAEEVRARLARRRMSGRQLAGLLGVSPSWVSYRLTGTQEIGLDDVQKIAEALGVPAIQLIEPALAALRRDGEPNVRLDQPTPFGPQRRDPSRPPGTTGPRQRRPQPVRHAA